jgi:hypothetical protein
MTTQTGNSFEAEPWPRTIRYCRNCQKHTPHEIREGAGVLAAICVPCIERALSYELDRE